MSRGWAAVALAAFAAALWLWREFPVRRATLVDTSLLASALFRSDSLTGFFRGVAIVAGIVLVLINWGHIVDEYAAEFHALDPVDDCRGQPVGVRERS